MGASKGYIYKKFIDIESAKRICINSGYMVETATMILKRFYSIKDLKKEFFFNNATLSTWFAYLPEEKGSLERLMVNRVEDYMNQVTESRSNPQWLGKLGYCPAKSAFFWRRGESNLIKYQVITVSRGLVESYLTSYIC